MRGRVSIKVNPERVNRMILALRATCSECGHKNKKNGACGGCGEDFEMNLSAAIEEYARHTDTPLKKLNPHLSRAIKDLLKTELDLWKEKHGRL